MKRTKCISFIKSGFTLIELLVVISIIGILISLSIFGLQGAREAARDGKRKADLEKIRGDLEIYKADCGKYPTGSGNVTFALGDPLNGDGSSSSCSPTNTYIKQTPEDPTSPNRVYVYFSDGITYEICTSLEQTTVGTLSCGGISSCGGFFCNYKVTSP